mmetsp:Transcript_16967/g.30538  ORF Transcript_16967/g.30538 Transcript_16967/m.30538 type:complete len:310 (+) Transcript_16967:287-1216(+)
MVKFLKGISICHQNNCVHRDLKLDNVLLAREDDLLSMKIADFGLACDLDKERLQKRCGSAGYIAPEIIAGAEQSPKVDIFSAGVILHILLAGVAPFHVAGELNVLRANAMCKIDLNTVYWAHISTPAKDLVRKMLAKEPINRVDILTAQQHPWLEKGFLEKMPSIVELIESPIKVSQKLNSNHFIELAQCTLITSPKTHHVRILARQVPSHNTGPTEHFSYTPVDICKKISYDIKEATTPSTNADSIVSSPNQELSAYATISSSFEGRLGDACKQLIREVKSPLLVAKRIKYKRKSLQVLTAADHNKKQ